MFFCKFLRIVAWIGLISGAFRAAVGFSVAFGLASPGALARYTTSDTTGAAIDSGLMIVGVSLLAGAIAEIGLSLWADRSLASR